MISNSGKKIFFKVLILSWACLYLLGIPKTVWATGNLQVHFFSVGYADAILVQCDDFIMLIDAGESHQGSKIYQYLAKNKIRKIDTAIITHPHKNHFGGFQVLLNKIKIGRVFTNGDTQAETGYAQLLESFHTQNIPLETLRHGSRLSALPEGLQVEVLHPREVSDNANDNSLVLWLTFGQTSFLLTADIGPEQQDHLIREKKFLKGATVVQIPHHGGPLSPQWGIFFNEPLFVISTGKNPWGLPQKDDLKNLNGPLYRTDRDGNIIFKSDGRKITVFKNAP